MQKTTVFHQGKVHIYKNKGASEGSSVVSMSQRHQYHCKYSKYFSFKARHVVNGFHFRIFDA